MSKGWHPRFNFARSENASKTGLRLRPQPIVLKPIVLKIAETVTKGVLGGLFVTVSAIISTIGFITYELNATVGLVELVVLAGKACGHRNAI